jgi:ketosteroid isomerase-like protein
MLMKKTSLLAAALLLPALVFAATPEADLQASFESLIAAERAFSKTSVEKGTREAFLTFLADDGLLFGPGPVNGKKQWEPRPAQSPGILIWRPIHADIAASGDLGYNTGPFEIRPNDPSRPKGYGHFMSIWKKQADGTWKVAVDMGNRHPAPAGSEPTVDGADTPIRLSGVKPATGKTGAPEIAALVEEDRAFGKEVASKGTEAAYLARLAAEPRLYRDGSYPAVGMAAAKKTLAGAPPLSTKPLGGDISKAGDFGYTYGEYQMRTAPAGGQPEAGHYTRIWRKQGKDWKLLLEVFNTLPPPPPPAKS